MTLLLSTVCQCVYEDVGVFITVCVRMCAPRPLNCRSVTESSVELCVFSCECNHGVVGSVVCARRCLLAAFFSLSHWLLSLRLSLVSPSRQPVITTLQVMTPAAVEAIASEVAKAHSLTITSIVGDDLLLKGLNLLHAVGRAAVYVFPPN